VITDGYHITKPLNINYKEAGTYCSFEVKCAIDDWQLILGFYCFSSFLFIWVFNRDIDIKDS